MVSSKDVSIGVENRRGNIRTEICQTIICQFKQVREKSEIRYGL